MQIKPLKLPSREFKPEGDTDWTNWYERRKLAFKKIEQLRRSRSLTRKKSNEILRELDTHRPDKREPSWEGRHRVVKLQYPSTFKGIKSKYKKLKTYFDDLSLLDGHNLSSDSIIKIKSKIPVKEIIDIIKFLYEAIEQPTPPLGKYEDLRPHINAAIELFNKEAPKIVMRHRRPGQDPEPELSEQPEDDEEIAI